MLPGAEAEPKHSRGTASRAVGLYLAGMVWLTVLIGAMPLWQLRGTAAGNESVWLAAGFLVLGLIDLRAGLVALVAALTLTPAFHMQLNALAGTHVAAWPYPGVDAVVGLLAAWALRRRVVQSCTSLVPGFPAVPFVLLHAWISVSALVSVAHNVWRSTGDVDGNGIKINAMTLRGLSWHDDFFPLQDWYYYTAAVALLLLVLHTLRSARRGRPLLAELTAALLVGCTLNAVFAIWQDWTDLGWVNGVVGLSVNAFWPDLHSFGALMVVGFCLSIGWLRVGSPSRRAKLLLVPAAALALLGLLASTSRFPILVLLVAALAVAVAAAVRARGIGRFMPLAAVAAFIVLSLWTLKHGYRGFTLATFAPLFEKLDPQNLNSILAYRPEIWASALRMYSSFPFAGLGQGSFAQLSGLGEFSSSEALVALGGESAHNYFLQTFVELGPVGGLLILLTLVPMWRMGRSNFSLVTFYGLVGIAIGNVYAHSLLVREMLMLGGALLAMYYWEAVASDRACIAPLSARVRSGVAAALVLGLGLASYEAVASFHRFPFTYGQRCFQPRQWADGWSSGLVREPIGPEVRHVEAQLSWPRRDLDRHPVVVEVKVLGMDGRVLRQQTLDAERPSLRVVPVAFDLPDDGSARTFVIQASRCYVPSNLGNTYDPRPLGFRLLLLRMSDADGRQVTSPE